MVENATFRQHRQIVIKFRILTFTDAGDYHGANYEFSEHLSIACRVFPISLYRYTTNNFKFLMEAIETNS